MGSGELRKRNGKGPTASPAAGSKAIVSPPPSKTEASSGNATRITDLGARVSPFVRETDFTELCYTPHTITAGFVLFVVAFVTAKYVGASSESHVKIGLGAVAFSFIAFGTIHLPDGLMVRPHPSVWRAVLSMAVMYMLLVVFLCFQDLKTIRQLVGLYDSTTFDMLPERSYAEDCRMSTPEEPHKFLNTVMDEFIIAHAMGYWAKMIVLRDWRVVTAVSLGFEVIEVTFQHILPNFRECWWDHLLVDILICNAGGTLLGWATLKLFKAKPYRWTKLSDIPSVPGKARRLVAQVLPRAGLSRYEWHMFDSLRQFSQVCLIIGAFFVQEVNAFTIKYILNMEPKHHLVPGRLVMWGLIAIPGIREYYDYISEPSVRRLGTTAWVGGFALVFETVWVMKAAYENDYFRQQWPAHIAVPWLLTLCMFVSWIVLFFATPRRIRRSSRGGSRALPARLWRMVLRGLWYGMLVLLVAVCVMGNDDVAWGRDAFESFVRHHGLWYFWRGTDAASAVNAHV